MPVLLPRMAGALAELVTDSVPAIAMFVPLWLTIESVTLALPPLLEKRGTNPV